MSRIAERSDRRFESTRCVLHIVAMGAALLSSSAQASEERPQEQDGLGLRIEELLSDKGVFRIEQSTTFSASRRTDLGGMFDVIQTGTGEFVSVPVAIDVSDLRSETLLSSLGVRYGLTTRAEVYARATARASQSRFWNSVTGTSAQVSHGSFQALTFGLNYRLADEGETPGLIGFADVAVLENVAASDSDFRSGLSGTIGFTTYRILDPVVVSMTAGYRPALARSLNGRRIDPGDAFFLNPSVAFAVNNELTLTSGLGLNYTVADTLDGQVQDSDAISADLQFGLAYAWDRRTTLRADARAETLGDRSVTVGLTVTRTFGRD